MMNKENAHSEALRSIDTKKRDELARQFNAETDMKKRIAIYKKMEPYENQLKKWFEKEKQLQKERKKVDKMYEELMASYGSG